MFVYLSTHGLRIYPNFDHSSRTLFSIYSKMASASPSELREYLKEAEDKLLTWTDKLEKAEALLERAKEKGDEELMEMARARIATAKEAIAHAKEDTKMYRKGIVAPPVAAVDTGRFHIIITSLPSSLHSDSRRSAFHVILV